jgi:hypothetical protein
MAVDPRKRQKKLMKKRRKDKERKKKRTVQEAFYSAAADPRNKVKAARNYPIYECLINPSWKKRGLAVILLSRRQPDGNITFGNYLVDIYCLGLKNTFCNVDFSPTRYRTEVVARSYDDETPEPCPVDLAHHIIYGAIDYAAQFGFEPEKDFDLSQYVLDAREDVGPCEGVEFGHNGKPLYVAGPHDNVEWVLKQLERTAGEGNFHYIAPFGDF